MKKILAVVLGLMAISGALEASYMRQVTFVNGYRLPAGSYLTGSGCSGCVWDNNDMLSCQSCWDSPGDVVKYWPLNVGSCQPYYQDIAICNGQLHCGPCR